MVVKTALNVFSSFENKKKWSATPHVHQQRPVCGGPICSTVVLFFRPLQCDGISTDWTVPLTVASQVGCYDENERHVISEGRMMPGKQLFCLSTSWILIPLSQLSPTAFTGLLFCEFPQCGQSTDVFKQNLSLLAISLSLRTVAFYHVTEHCNIVTIARVLFANEAWLTLGQCFVLHIAFSHNI